mgnify:CR=1 FL=1
MESKMEQNNFGKTTIAAEVLISIARLATLSVEGVCRLTPAPREVDSLFKKGISEGIDILVENNAVFVDIYVMLEVNVLKEYLDDCVPYMDELILL